MKRIGCLMALATVMLAGCGTSTQPGAPMAAGSALVSSKTSEQKAFKAEVCTVNFSERDAIFGLRLVPTDPKMKALAYGYRLKVGGKQLMYDKVNPVSASLFLGKKGELYLSFQNPELKKRQFFKVGSYEAQRIQEGQPMEYTLEAGLSAKAINENGWEFAVELSIDQLPTPEAKEPKLYDRHISGPIFNW